MSEHNEAEPPSRGWRRPDASMSLLADLFGGTAAYPGYAEAAARRVARGEPARRGPLRGGGVVFVLVLVGVLLAVAGADVRRSEPVAHKQRTRLVGEIRGRTAESDELQRRLDRLRTETERLRAGALARSEAGRRTREDLARISAAAAATPVSGGGLVITLDDAQDDPKNGDAAEPADGRVYDQDLQTLVNGLWASGAGAIGINGQRLTATTAIRTAGEAILVDFRPLTPPYVVTALGDRDRLGETFADSPATRYLESLESRFGMRFDVRRERELRLNGAGTLNLRYAREGRPR